MLIKKQLTSIKKIYLVIYFEEYTIFFIDVVLDRIDKSVLLAKISHIIESGEQKTYFSYRKDTYFFKIKLKDIRDK